MKDRSKPLTLYGQRLDQIRNVASARVCRRGWVDAEPYTMLLGSLYRKGETCDRMAALAHVDVRTIERIVFGEAKRIQARTAHLVELTARLILDVA
jgi:hypothetical protein